MSAGARVARLVAVLTVGLGVLSAAPAFATENTEYVALGDSYTAGPLIPPSTGQPPGCLRSDRNYPALVAKELNAASFTDVSCSSATTKQLANPQQVLAGTNPPQLDAPRGSTSLVTLGIGGNDIGFGEIVQKCTVLSPTQPSGAACRAFYTAGGSDRLVARIEATAPKIADALAEIHERSPDAQVLLVGYPVIAPHTGAGCLLFLPFSEGDADYLRGIEQQLNVMLAEQADEAGAEFVDTYTPSIGHDACQPVGEKWVEGLIPTDSAAPVHPNKLGMQASARAVLGHLDSKAA